MPVTAADLTYPVGEIRTEWFTGEDLSANLALWIGEGEAAAPVGSTTAQVDTIAEAWGYVRAYDAKTMQLAGSPDSASLEGLGSTTLVKGRDFFDARAKAWRAVYDAAVGAAEAGSTVAENVAAPLASTSAPFSVSF